MQTLQLQFLIKVFQWHRSQHGSLSQQTMVSVGQHHHCRNPMSHCQVMPSVEVFCSLLMKPAVT